MGRGGLVIETSDDRLIFLDDILGEDGYKAITHNEGEHDASPGSLPRGEADPEMLLQDGPRPVCASLTVLTKPRCSTGYKLPLRNPTAASAATRARRCRSGGTLRDTSGSRRSIACRKWDGRSRTGKSWKSRWADSIKSRGEGAGLGSLSVGGKGSRRLTFCGNPKTGTTATTILTRRCTPSLSLTVPLPTPSKPSPPPSALDKPLAASLQILTRT